MSEKNGISVEALEKSLAELEDATAGGQSRKAELLQKSESERLSEEESAELVALLSGRSNAGGEIRKAMGEGESLQKALDVSDFLRDLHSNVTDALETIGEDLAKSQIERQEYESVLAKALIDVGGTVKDLVELTKSLKDEVEAMSGKPVRQPEAINPGHKTVEPIEKGFAGSQPAKGTLHDREAVLNVLEGELSKSVDAGRAGRTETGEDLYQVIPLVEQAGPHMLSDALKETVAKALS
jgi:hypothetical protein